MAFESLSYRHVVIINNFPIRWLPLIHLYDPDLPLFPLYYFHKLSNSISAGQRPGQTDRVFGYIEKINLINTTVEVTTVTNKDLSLPANQTYMQLTEDVVKERLQVYEKQTKPLISYYQTHGKLHVINGEQPIQKILEDILRTIGAQ